VALRPAAGGRIAAHNGLMTAAGDSVERAAAWMSPVRRPSQWWQHPLLADLAVPAALAVLASGALAADGDTRWWVWLLAGLLLVPLLWRRRHPTHVFVLLAAVALVQWTAGVRLVADVALLIALYTVAAHRDRRHWLPAAGVLEVGVVLASARFAPAGDGVFGSIVFLTGLVTAALFLGTTVRTRREYLSALEDRARRLERERDQQARLAATAERTRIAREMHDVIAHSLSVVVALADGAAASQRKDPAEAEGAMQQVAATGRQALTEMRRLLGVLRDDEPATRAPQPTLARLDELLEDVRATGLTVQFTVTGAPQPLPSTAEATVFRVVQESMTNVLKHAQSVSVVNVRVAWSPEALTVHITDDGHGPLSAASTRGHGLQGMRERVALYDGELTAGPTDTGGWQVRAHLPLASVPL
jgi:signal transduction histidine kinase